MNAPAESDYSRLNIFGRPLKNCCLDPITGYYRDGTCRSNLADGGNHSVCTILSQEFLSYTKAQGNDLSTPAPQYGFPGLKAGDKWCLCARRWLEAKKNGIKVEVDLEATHLRALEVTSDFDFNPKYRVIKCSTKLYPIQFEQILQNIDIATEQTLVAVPDQTIDNCKLYAPNNNLLAESSSIFDVGNIESYFS